MCYCTCLFDSPVRDIIIPILTDAALEDERGCYQTHIVSIKKQGKSKNQTRHLSCLTGCCVVFSFEVSQAFQI